MHETATEKRPRDTLCIQLTNVQNLETTGLDGNHRAPGSHWFCGELCQRLWLYGALVPRCCLTPWCMFGLCSRQNKRVPSFPLDSLAYLPLAAKHPDLWDSLQPHSQHTSQPWDKHGWDHGLHQERRRRKVPFLWSEGKPSKGITRVWVTVCLLHDSGDKAASCSGAGAKSQPVIIVSHNPSYTKSSRNHTCKCLNLKCKINTRKIAATCFL